MIAAGWVATRSATFGGVEARAAADPDEAVEVAVDREVGRLLQRLRGRLDARAVEDDRLDAGRLDRLHLRGR
jgi:hypothetical protein